MKQKRSLGFTLIELLMVIAIIGILAAVVMVSLNEARKKGRDARRIRDIQEVSNAIELYIAQNGAAPDLGYGCADPESGDTSCFASETPDSGQGYINWQTLKTQLSPYISALPVDPCGAQCYQPSGQLNGGFFAYYYAAPAMLGPGIDSSGMTGIERGVNQTSFRIYAENLETRVDSYGFGLGSF